MLNTYSVISYISKVIILAALYIGAGEIGLMLSVPPDYKVLIWPPSGIALGMLVVYGWRIFPGIFIGSLYTACTFLEIIPRLGAFSLDCLAAIGIAIGSTLQALVGYTIIYKLFGRPMKLQGPKDVVKILTLSVFLSCIIAASIGVTSLYFSGHLEAQDLQEMWLNWWRNSVLGILVFFPLVLIFPNSKNILNWRGNDLKSLPILSLLTILIPLGLTFYAWKFSAENTYQRTYAQFESLAQENEKALLNRINAYKYALLGGVGFFQGSEEITRQEWRDYVTAVEVEENFPGINGIGWIAPVKPDQAESYVKSIRADGVPGFKIHPQTEGLPLYVITYIEPENINVEAIGLNIGFEKNRRDAANLARDSGEAAITKRIILVQDADKTPGFLLLQPLYNNNAKIDTIEDRRGAFRGWVYAPFIAKNFMEGLTNSQGENLRLEVYDGKGESLDHVIYNPETPANSENFTPDFVIRKTVNVMQQDWTLVWKSTEKFESNHQNSQPLFILLGGLIFTGLFTIFLVVSTTRNTEILEKITQEKRLAIPVVILCLVSSGAFYLYHTLNKQELNYIRNTVNDEATKIQQLVSFQATDKLLALNRMGERWNAGGGTPEPLWRADAENYVAHLEGLTTVEWVDSTYHVRWVEPYIGNENIVGLDILFDKDREKALRGAAEKNTLTLTPPLDLVQGYKAFIAYTPLKVEEKFEGFIVGIFAIEEFFENILSQDIVSNYAVYLDYEGIEFFQNTLTSKTLVNELEQVKILKIYDKEWRIRIIPTKEFVEGEKTMLPSIILVAGLMIAILLSLTVRYIIISRIRSYHLESSERTFRTAIENASIGMALVGLEGQWLVVNEALCKLTGYTEDELLNTDFQTITHPDDLNKDLEYLKETLNGQRNTYEIEKRYFHKDGYVIWALLNVSIARHADGRPKYFIAQIQDVTERRKMDEMKSEFISTVSHELRTPLTSIRGSLGLIEGTMADKIPDQAKHLISIAHKNCERLIMLINDILDLDKITAGQISFNMTDHSLKDLVAAGVESNQSYGDKYNVNFEVEPIPHDLTVHVDPDRWQQIFANLLSNAAKFSPEGENVIIKATVENKKIRLYVQDKGSGIPPEFQEKIFTKFSQADSKISRSKGGTGLGLNISKQLVEAMNGDIGFETEVDKGTSFWIDFPKVEKQRSGRSSTDKEVGPEPSSNNKGPKVKILHIEDDRDFADVLKSGFGNQVEFTLAPTLKEARMLLKETEYSAVIIDVVMPDGSGIDLIKYIKDEISDDMPIVILSSDDPPKTVYETVESVMVKSRISEKEIISKILKILNQEK